MKQTTFENFNSVQHPPLRTYNRVVTSHNIKEDFGVAVMNEYISQFSKDEMYRMMLVLNYIKKNGVKATLDLVMKGFEPEEPDHSDIENVS